MLKTKTEDIEMGGNHYRLTKLDARTGSYVAAKIALLCSPMMKNGGKNIKPEDVSQMLPNLSQKDFIELQNTVLKTVYELQTDSTGNYTVPSPILTAEGKFVSEELAYDTGTVIALTVRAAIFNVGSFFGGVGRLTPKQ